VSANGPASVRHDDLSLIELWRLARRNRILISAITGICAIAATIYSLTATPMYRAEVVVTETREGGLGGVAASLAGQFGGIASLAGLDLGSGDTAGRKAQAVLKSRNLAEEFIKRNGLTAELTAGSTKPRTLWRAVEVFRKRVVSFRDEKRSGTTTVAIDWKDSMTSARWANEYVALANELLRTRAIEDASRNIDFLNGQISRTNVVEIQHVMYKLIEDQTKNLMLASGRVDYAFTSVDPAVAPELRSSPQRTLIVLGGIALGLVIGCLAAFLRDLSSRV
jgi:uncharacterized protein involved in exopolysaccharide biosynthesis